MAPQGLQRRIVDRAINRSSGRASLAKLQNRSRLTSVRHVTACGEADVRWNVSSGLSKEAFDEAA
jgi:hypothetical protein